MAGKLEENLSFINKKIESLREQNASLPRPIILGVSKMQSVEKIKALYELGILDFGENYLQEALAKKTLLKDLPIRWHFIGQLQTKKIREIVGEFSIIQTLSRKSELEKISAVAQQKNCLQKVLIQVNIANETSKQGVSLEELEDLVEATTRSANVVLRGLMFFPPADIETAEYWFERCSALFAEYQKKDPDHFQVLSMGTSQDYGIAVSKGANMLRLGECLFGPRPTK